MCTADVADILTAFAKQVVNEFPFQLKVEDSLQKATLRFVTKAEIQRYHRSLSAFAHESSMAVREAVEFTRLAAKRWRY